MGYAIAEQARDMGAAVTLISGPVALTEPSEMDVVNNNTASDHSVRYLSVCPPPQRGIIIIIIIS